MSRTGLAVAVLVLVLGACGGSVTSRSQAGGGDAAADAGQMYFASRDGAACVPKTCNELPEICGPQTDGCGGVVRCDYIGTGAPFHCDGGSSGGDAGTAEAAVDAGAESGSVACCTPKTCADYAAGTCGQQSDGCGGLTVSCGTCVNPQTCGFAGFHSQCGGCAGGAGCPCVPLTCVDLGSPCGAEADGCGGVIVCATCASVAYCGDGGLVPCTSKTCAQQGFTCGANSDGCGHVIQCGMCTGSDFCGGGGYSKCGSPNGNDSGPICTPKTCADFPAGTCGQQSDFCGGITATCGANDAGGLCPSGQFCGGGGPGLCGGSGPIICPQGNCVPQTCESLDCGLAGDGCGGLLECGPCPLSEACINHQCVWPADAGPCVPATCQGLAYDCGFLSDGCGGHLDCGTCPVSQFCGGGGVHRCGGTCAAPDGGSPCQVTCSSGDGGGCIGQSCLGSGRACGEAPNGCGGLLDCGPCGGDAGASDAPAGNGE